MRSTLLKFMRTQLRAEIKGCYPLREMEVDKPSTIKVEIRMKMFIAGMAMMRKLVITIDPLREWRERLTKNPRDRSSERNYEDNVREKISEYSTMRMRYATHIGRGSGRNKACALRT